MKVKDIIQEARSPEEFMSQLRSTAPDIKQVYQKYLKSPHYRPFRTSDDDTREYQIWTDNFAQFLRKEFGHMPQDLAFEIGNHLYDYIKMRNREDPEGVAENRTISRPNDPSIAIKRFTAYVQRNINDLASMVEFTLQQKNEPYIDDKFVNYLIKADGTPVTPVFNGGGDVELLGPQKNYLNIPVLKFSYYRGFMYGGDLINQIREQLGYKTKGMAEGSLQEFAPGNGGGDGRWYTDDEIADIIGEDWFEFDLSGEAANISQHGEHAKILLVQEAQAYFEDRGYHGVTVQDVRDDEDFLSWYISGNFTRLGEGVAEQVETCSECGGPSYSNPILAEKKDACYHKVKSRVKVWPSAYASGQLVQCRKRGASNWGTGGKKK